MAKERKTPGSRIISNAVREQLSTGSRESANLAESLAVDFARLMRTIHPDLDEAVIRRLADGNPTITERMKIAGEIVLAEFGIAPNEFMNHPSDTVRGWAAYTIGLAPDLSLKDRFRWMQPLANDSHFGVREWAWLPLRPHISAEVEVAVTLLEPWVHEESHYLRRFAVEATRPRGVWTEHIPQLKSEPWLGLPLLRPLRADPEKYVQDSVSNWLNDAAKSQSDWVRELCEDWAADAEGNPATLRICRRALRSLREETE